MSVKGKKKAIFLQNYGNPENRGVERKKKAGKFIFFPISQTSIRIQCHFKRMVLYCQLPNCRILAFDCRFEGDKYFGFGHMNISYIDVHTKLI